MILRDSRSLTCKSCWISEMAPLPSLWRSSSPRRSVTHSLTQSAIFISRMVAHVAEMMTVTVTVIFSGGSFGSGESSPVVSRTCHPLRDGIDCWGAREPMRSSRETFFFYWIILHRMDHDNNLSLDKNNVKTGTVRGRFASGLPSR